MLPFMFSIQLKRKFLLDLIPGPPGDGYLSAISTLTRSILKTEHLSRHGIRNMGLLDFIHPDSFSF